MMYLLNVGKILRGLSH